MTLSAVIIILREVLEAALLLSLLVSSTRLMALSYRGIIAGLLLGLAGAVTATRLMDTISESFDGVGQEVLNALLLVAIVVLLLVYVAGLDRRAVKGDGLMNPLLLLTSCLVVAMAITREGMEIIIFIYGFSADPVEMLPVLVGGAIGAGIGISVGVLIYYTLINLPVRLEILVPVLLLALVASGMASQAVVYLMQGGLIASQLPVWDTSGWVAETSVTGQLLYALLGYEATPTLVQLGVYGFTLAVFLLVIVAGRRLRGAAQARGME
ncbi:MAG: FTR1 family protein [Gammaproteobacteria bacterium]|jgi:high-affinity iron transporter